MNYKYPAYVPFEVASNDFLLYKFCRIVARGGVPPKKLIKELDKRGLLKKAIEKAKYYTNGIPSRNTNGYIKLRILRKVLAMLPKRYAIDLAYRLEFYHNYKFVIDGYYRKKYPAMVIEITCEYMKLVVMFSNGFEIVKCSHADFTPK